MNTFVRHALIVAACAVIIGGCAKKTDTDSVDFVSQTSQDATKYIHDHKELTPEHSRKLMKEDYLKTTYSVWDMSKINHDIAEVFWILPSMQSAIKLDAQLQEMKKDLPQRGSSKYAEYKKELDELNDKVINILGYGENLMPNRVEDFKNIVDDMNLEEFNKDPKIGIVVGSGPARAVPTLKPRYKSHDDFPFDRWQNSLVFEGTPVLITHASKTGRFVHVKTPYVYGWMEVKNVAVVDEKMKQSLIGISDYKVPKRDLVPLKYGKDWLMDARIGQIIPSKDGRLMVFYKNKDGYADVRMVEFDKDSFDSFPMIFTEDNMADIINAMMNQKYGWGGIYENRDCSAFTRDSFASFGIFLPRNSQAQATTAGKLMDVSKMGDDEKEKFIIDNAVPFGSIIWLKGHIMLYIGHAVVDGEDRALVAHSAWSISSTVLRKKHIVNLGGVHITTLWVGTEMVSHEIAKGTLISRVIGVTNIKTPDNNTLSTVPDNRRMTRAHLTARLMR